MQVPELWEEIIVLINAGSAEAAATAAVSAGKSREHEYEVADPWPHILRWEFMHVERVHSIDEHELGDDTEVFSRFLRKSEVESLLTPFEDKPAGPR